jgi:hypothetical protein
VENIFQKYVPRGISIEFESILRVFNTVYNIVKNSRPFTDLPYDVQLQKSNELNMDPYH